MMEAAEQNVVVKEMLVTHRKNFKSVPLFTTTPTQLGTSREDLPLPHARCFLLRNLLSEKECQVLLHFSV